VIEKQQLHAIVHGLVQGVFFRASTRDAAHRLHLVGWVRNLADESVEVLAEGDRPTLERLLGFLHQGPPDARVTQVEVEWNAAAGEFMDFRVR